VALWTPPLRELTFADVIVASCGLARNQPTVLWPRVNWFVDLALRRIVRPAA
jgi:hypothetical protein